MKIGIVTDSACDLPKSFIDANGIEILPITLHFGNEYYTDVRDPHDTMAFYQRYVAEKTLDAETVPFSAEQIRDLFLDRLVLKYDRVIVLTVTSTRSAIYENATKASFAILNDYHDRRRRAGISGPFLMRVVDSKTLFTGQAVLAREAVRLVQEDQAAFDKLRQTAEALSRNVYAYLVPDDLFYMYNRTRQRGEKSVGWFSYRVGSSLDIKPVIQMHRGETAPVAKVRGFDNAFAELLGIAEKRIREDDLQPRVICMSYAGNPDLITRHPRYIEFAELARKHDVELLMAVMSTTAGVNVGPGAFSLAYAARTAAG